MNNVVKPFLINPVKLGINGKVMDISDIREMTLQDFVARLQENGVSVSDERAERVYNQMRDMADAYDKAQEESQEQSNLEEQ